MSAADTEVTTPPRWQDWRHRRTPVRAIQYDNTENGRHVIANEVNRAGPDLARITPAGELLIRMQLRSAPVPPGFWVGLGYNGHPWVISHEVFVGCYDPAGPDDYSATFTPAQVATLLQAATETEDPRELRRRLVELARSHELLR